MQTATVAAVDWWAAQRGANVSVWIGDYQKSLHRAHRTAIVEIVRRYDVASVLEVGCHCGPNLIRLAQDVPTLTDLFGIDASAQAVQAGQEWANESGLGDRVQMREGRFPAATASMADGCADVVLSCYSLAYLSPEDLDAALFEIGRLAKKVVILAEPVSPGEPTSLSRTANGYQEWAHAYGRALKWIGSLRGMTLRTLTMNPPIDNLNAILVLERA